jgi:hypothetical protein
MWPLHVLLVASSVIHSVSKCFLFPLHACFIVLILVVIQAATEGTIEGDGKYIIDRVQ